MPERRRHMRKHRDLIAEWPVGAGKPLVDGRKFGGEFARRDISHSGHCFPHRALVGCRTLNPATDTVKCIPVRASLSPDWRSSYIGRAGRRYCNVGVTGLRPRRVAIGLCLAGIVAAADLCRAADGGLVAGLNRAIVAEESRAGSTSSHLLPLLDPL